MKYLNGWFIEGTSPFPLETEKAMIEDKQLRLANIEPPIQIEVKEVNREQCRREVFPFLEPDPPLRRR